MRIDGGDAAWVAGLLAALGALIYISPARAWKLLAESMRDQVRDLTKRVDRLETTIEQRDKAIEQRDGVIRRLRSIRSVLENLLHVHSIPIPAFLDDDHPDVAPERRAPTVSTTAETIADASAHQE